MMALFVGGKVATLEPPTPAPVPPARLTTFTVWEVKDYFGDKKEPWEEWSYATLEAANASTGWFNPEKEHWTIEPIEVTRLPYQDVYFNSELLGVYVNYSGKPGRRKVTRVMTRITASEGGIYGETSICGKRVLCRFQVDTLDQWEAVARLDQEGRIG